MSFPTVTLAPRRIALHIKREAEHALRAGHPWLFADSITKQSHEGQAGDLAVVFDQKGRFLAIGLYDPTSMIRLRVLHQGTPATIDPAWFQAKLKEAIARRAALTADRRTTGYRLVHGENDGLPGLVIDRYDQTLVIKLYSLAWIPHLLDLWAGLAALLAGLPVQRLVLRMNRAMQKSLAALHGLTDGEILVGPPLDGPVRFLENGLTFEADPIQGQKTGFFLDQRENRARVEKLSAGRRVLNVFAYNGGFSLYAARGGATHVSSLDISRPALESAQRNFALNQQMPTVAAAEHRLLVGDAFQLLGELRSQQQGKGEKFDLVIIDPPAFAKEQSEVERALAAYAHLTRLGLGVLQVGGLLVMASCSSRVPAESFFATIGQQAARIGRPLRVLEQTAHPLDHPIGFAEGAYLKCLYATC